MGDVRPNNFPYRSIDYKWFTPPEAWPDKPYPIYAMGTAYIVSTDLAPKLLEQSTRMPAFKWEDIYVGILMNQLKVVPYPHIHIDSRGSYRNLCASKSVLATHGFDSNAFIRYWKGLGINISEECVGILNEGTIPKFSPRNGFQDLNESHSTQTEWYSPSVKISSVFRSLPEEVFLLVVVMTTPTQYNYRKYFRIVYGRSSRVLGQNVIVRFVVDGSSDDSLQKFVLQENELYGDMVLLKARGSSNRASQRLSATLKWAATMDEPVKFVMVSEITVYVNIENVVRAAMAAPDKNYVTCHVKSNSVAVRSKGSPWFVSFEDWEGDVYPPHCTTGTPFVVSFDVVLKMVDVARRRPIFKFPDVYMGILLREANLTLAHQDKFSLQPVNKHIDVLDQHFCHVQTVFSLQELSPIHVDLILRKAMTQKKQAADSSQREVQTN
ncbi:beta-1,3-galactosyltransferase 1-like [Ptychodera flava]|uniref:beta-1,3-galactosyltransferase 1-like n=1 Tax=Ptychodera flava TaxID=63121 RepID=UPI00396A6F14